MAHIQLNYEILDDSIHFWFSKKKRIGNRSGFDIKDLAKGEFVNIHGKTVNKYALNALLNLAENLSIESKDNFHIPHKDFLDIDDEYSSFSMVLESLGFPRVSVQLDMKEDRIVTDEKFQIQLSFLKNNGSVLFAERRGIFLMQGKEAVSSLSREMFEICELVKEINSGQSRDINFKGMACFQEHLKAMPEKAQLSDYLKNMRISHASKFTLNVNITKDGFDFEPLLLTTDSDEMSDKNLLAPLIQKDFALDLFLRKGARSSYILKDKSYLYVDKKLQEALSVVREMKDADRETRRAFVKNPRSFINAKLSTEAGGENIGELLEFLFVETATYSARVEEIGVWESPKLPWINIKGQQWIPNTDDLFVKSDNQVIVVSPAEIQNLKIAVENALHNNEATIIFNGTILDVTPELLKSLAAPSQTMDENGLIDQELHQLNETPEKEAKLKLVLLTRDNFDAVKFSEYRGKKRNGPGTTIPTCLITPLHPYQRTGLQWMQDSWRSGVTGCLLADDMGLGKTFQVLSFLSWVQEISKKPILIVAPTSLSKNWENEAKKHLRSPHLGNLVKLYGTDLQYLKSSRDKESSVGRPSLNIAEIKRADWIITSYETMRDYEHSLGSISFSVVVFDEMQKLKNPSALVTKAAKALNSQFTLGLTGTPVENRLADVYSLCDVLRPGFLGSLEDFSKHYESDLQNRERLLQLKAKLESGFESLPPFMLRRMKKDALAEGALKEKRIETVKQAMPTKQQTAYNGVLAEYRNKDQKGKLLEALQGLRKVSLNYTDPETDGISTKDLFENSARLSYTAQILEEIKNKNEKVLIFLESRRMQTELQTFILEKYGFRPNIINGQTVTAKRQQYVDSFESTIDGFDIIILSPKAAGTGFTLISANHVIHLSRWWNPATEDQATDRAYRIGQKKEVYVYYPLAIHPQYGDASFDAKLHQFISCKRQLSDELLLPAGAADGNMENKSTIEQLYSDTFNAVALQL